MPYNFLGTPNIPDWPAGASIKPVTLGLGKIDLSARPVPALILASANRNMGGWTCVKCFNLIAPGEVHNPTTFWGQRAGQHIECSEGT